jgi:hypothetical protein
MALSKVFKVGDFYARAANRCNQVEDFQLDENSLCSIAQMEIIGNFAAASSSIRRDYQTHKSMTVVDPSTASPHIDISNESIYDVTNISVGMTRLYHHAKSITEFVNVNAPESHEQKTHGRYWYAAPGEDRILLMRGTDAIASDGAALNVWYIRYPDLSAMNMEGVKANTVYVDLPTWCVPYFIVATAISAVKEQGLNVPQSLANEMTGIIGGLSDKLAKEEIELRQMQLTNATR